jgi:hypothetical protein
MEVTNGGIWLKGLAEFSLATRALLIRIMAESAAALDE